MQLQGFQKKTIARHETFGMQLKAARQKKHISLEKAEQDTKIRTFFLTAMENDSIGDLPPAQYRGFFRRYGEYLNLAVGIITRELEHLPPIHPRRLFSPHTLRNQTRWIITPRGVAIGLLFVVLITFIGYVTYQVQQFAASPALALTNPEGEVVVTSEDFTIEGTADPGATVTIDDLATGVGSNGTFSYPLKLRPGLNQLTIRTENRIKKSASQIITILYQPPTPNLTPSPNL